MPINTSPEKIHELLARSVEEIISRENLEKKLRSGKKLRVKLGADPSRPDLHLGHAVVLRKLREFQDLGHQIVFIIGDYTGMIGDPSGKSTTRPQLSSQEVNKNAKTYLAQVGKILDIKKTEIRRNSEWYAKMKFHEVLNLTGKFSVQRLLERDDFHKRIRENRELRVHELLYPIMQAYDSVMIKADVELGGTDQKFNVLAGRKLQRRLELPEQDIVTIPLLVGLDGKNKMSKSLDNYIGITEPAGSMYGKIMSIPDTALVHYFELATQLTAEEIESIKKELRLPQCNPRDIKMRLAREVVALYHSARAAAEAEQHFIQVFQKKELPDVMRECVIREEKIPLTDLLVRAKFASSNGEARRLITQKGISIDDTVIDDARKIIEVPKKGIVIKKGRRHFVKVKTR